MSCRRDGLRVILAGMEPKLCLPVALAVIVLAGCGESHPADAGPPSDGGAVADGAPFDAGCMPFEEWDPVLMECLPLA